MIVTAGKVGAKAYRKLYNVINKSKIKIKLKKYGKAVKLPKKKPGFWKSQWLETKAEGKSVWKGTKKFPKKFAKAAWDHPITTGVVGGAGLGLMFGEKRVRYGYNNKSKKT